MSGGKFIIEKLRSLEARIDAVEKSKSSDKEKVEENVNSNLFERMKAIEDKYKALNARMGKKKDD